MVVQRKSRQAHQASWELEARLPDDQGALPGQPGQVMPLWDH